MEKTPFWPFWAFLGAGVREPFGTAVNNSTLATDSILISLGD
jgi:hypothetical protein